jgi:Aspartyl protease
LNSTGIDAFQGVVTPKTPAMGTCRVYSVQRFCAALVLIAGMLDSFPLAAASTPCKIAQITELHVRLAANLPMMDGEINGQGVQILLNTGGYRTFIGGETARRLHLPLRQYTDEQAFGLGGAVPVLTTIVNEFKLGEFTARDVRFGSSKFYDFLTGCQKCGHYSSEQCDDGTCDCSPGNFRQTDDQLDRQV